jgi:DNA-binding FadR family transcriptional regulator
VLDAIVARRPEAARCAMAALLADTRAFLDARTDDASPRRRDRKRGNGKDGA